MGVPAACAGARLTHAREREGRHGAYPCHMSRADEEDNALCVYVEKESDMLLEKKATTMRKVLNLKFQSLP